MRIKWRLCHMKMIGRLYARCDHASKEDTEALYESLLRAQNIIACRLRCLPLCAQHCSVVLNAQPRAHEEATGQCVAVIASGKVSLLSFSLPSSDHYDIIPHNLFFSVF